MYLSPAARQALMGLRVLGKAPFGEYRLVGQIAREACLPVNASAKIFQRLSRRGVLVSQRGPGGGYALAKPPEETLISEIMQAVQDIIPGGRHCLLGNSQCDEGPFCLIHQVIAKADRFVLEEFRALTLRQLSDSTGW